MAIPIRDRHSQSPLPHPQGVGFPFSLKRAPHRGQSESNPDRVMCQTGQVEKGVSFGTQNRILGARLGWLLTYGL